MSDAEVVFTGVKLLQEAINKIGLTKKPALKVKAGEKQDYIALYDNLILSDELRSTTRQLYVDGHYTRAVEEAYKCVNNTVKDKSQLILDGQDLMNQAFSEKNPVLKINDLKTVSHKDEQKGYMFIFGGCMTGIRNPRAHEHKKIDSPGSALEMLVWANHLMEIVQKAKRVKKQQKLPTP
jgi:uncharacterized protein (TIGR02391 family)